MLIRNMVGSKIITRNRQLYENSLSITQVAKRYGLRGILYQLYKQVKEINVFFKMNCCLQRMISLTPARYNVMDLSARGAWVLRGEI